MNSPTPTITVLVTGGAGYVGSHTVTKLLEAGFGVVVVDNLSTGFVEAVDSRAVFVPMDVRDTEALAKVMREHRVQALIHFAAKLNVKESTEKPLEYYEHNVMGTVSVLKAIQGVGGVRSFVFSSTSNIFGEVAEGSLIAESAPKAPINPYGSSKLMCEKVIQDQSAQSDFKYVFLRYFNVAGASLCGTNGQRTRNPYHLIHVASQGALRLRPCVEVHGTDYPTSDGTCIRDYIHVEDIADIHVMALQYLLAGGSSEEFNCGYGQGASVLEVLNTMKAVTGVEFPILAGPPRPGDSSFLVADPQKIKRILGWSPRFDSLNVICKTAFEWERKIQLEDSKK